MVVFWKYDLFPYVLWAEVEEECKDGGIIPKGYRGYIKTYNYVLHTDAKAKKIIDRLEELKGERKEVEDRTYEEAKSLIQFPKA